jgi:cytochrome c-type biogenesis protein CcmH
MTPLFLASAVGLSLLAALLIGIPLWRPRGERSKAGLAGLLALVVLVPLAVLSLYTQVSSYPWDKPERLTAPPPGSPEQIEMMVDQLADRMRQEPTAEGLSMLGRSYTVLERFDDALNAYQQAWELTEGKAPTVTLSYAEAMVLADRTTIATTAGDLLDEVLAELPNNPKALWYGGLSAIARGNAAIAQERWLRLLNQPDIPDQLRLVVQQQLTAMTDPTAPAGDLAEATQNSATGLFINVNVSITDRLESELSGNETLFVFARETGRPGPPVAVKRIASPVLPLQINISDADVMMAGNSLANITSLEITARLSRSGNATASSGDWFGTVTPEWPSDSHETSIQIDQAVP